MAGGMTGITLPCVITVAAHAGGAQRHPLVAKRD